MIRVFTRQIEKLHTEDGQALVFVALMGLVIFLFFAMTMNVAELVNTKIKNQNAADAAALSAAVWQARVLNLVSAANRNMLELWALALVAGPGCLALGLFCHELVCGEVWVDPIYCLGCLVLTFFACEAALALAGGAVTTGAFQEMVLDVIDRQVVDPDIPDVVALNYAFKASTASGDVGVYLYYPFQSEDLLQAYVPGGPESGSEVLERVGVCEVAIMIARYVNYLWHEYGVGLTDDDWQSILPTVYDWYSPGGVCYEQTTVPAGLDPALAMLFPLALRTRTSDWNPQNLDSLLAIRVATFKDQKPPVALGKGSGPADCKWEENETRFACPNARHYAFAASHAYSESVSRFYNTEMAGLDTSHLVTYIPFEMDWRPRLFPFEPYPNGVESEAPYGGWAAYQDIADQIEADGFPEDSDFLFRNLLMLNDMHFFLY